MPQAHHQSPRYGEQPPQKPSIVAQSNYDPLDVDGNADGESDNRLPTNGNFAPAFKEAPQPPPVQPIKTKLLIQPLTKEEIDELNKELLTPLIENNEIL